jgi:hypothetical protein
MVSVTHSNYAWCPTAADAQKQPSHWVRNQVVYIFCPVITYHHVYTLSVTRLRYMNMSTLGLSRRKMRCTNVDDWYYSFSITSLHFKGEVSKNIDTSLGNTQHKFTQITQRWISWKLIQKFPIYLSKSKTFYRRILQENSPPHRSFFFFPSLTYTKFPNYLFKSKTFYRRILQENSLPHRSFFFFLPLFVHLFIQK